MPMQQARPIVVVTGANGGVGYAICQRLLLQLVHGVPPDALPQRSVSRSIPLNSQAEVDLSEFVDCEGLTLILACRSVSKAEAARTELLEHLDKEVERIKKRNGKGTKDKDVRHAEEFRANTRLIVHRVDLASIESVFSFAREIESKYPYISHLVCNAGVASFTGYNWPLAFKQLATEFIAAVTAPLYKLQRVGELSEDGLGYVWQCNVFGHYVLFRLLEPLLVRYKHQTTSSPARILWMSSLEAYPAAFDDPSDWQLIRTPKPYEASKYQVDLLVGWFERQQQRKISDSGLGKGMEEVPVRHFLFHPGVVRTNIALSSLNSVFLDYCMQLSFLIAHILGSPAHVITPYKSAISATHLMLVALPFVTVATQATSSSNSPSQDGQGRYSPPSKPQSANDINTKKTETTTNENTSHTSSPTPLKFGSEVDFWFNERVGTSKVQEWGERQEQAEELVQHCEELFQKFKQKEEARIQA